MEAVNTALALMRRPWKISNFPSGIQPIITAAMEARKPTMIAWHCMNNQEISIVW